MKRRCVALLSGGLDSMLAIRIMQAQGVDVEALNFKTVFTCCQDQSAQAARMLGVRLTVVAQSKDYLDLVRNPHFGYGRGANPCVDCRIYMFRQAERFMHQVGAQFVVSGEIVGQRPKSQKKRDLQAISYHCGLDDLLLRPLSATLLPPTLPEREGWVDRQQLYGFCGRGRKGLIQLARHFGFADIPGPSTGCALTERQFSKKVFDIIRLQPAADWWDFEMLKYGRHFRFDRATKVVVGRRQIENDHLQYMHARPDAASTALLGPHNFQGPIALLLGPATEPALEFACGLVLRYSKSIDEQGADVEVQLRDRFRIMHARVSDAVRQARTLSSTRRG